METADVIFEAVDAHTHVTFLPFSFKTFQELKLYFTASF